MLHNSEQNYAERLETPLSWHFRVPVNGSNNIDKNKTIKENVLQTLCHYVIYLSQAAMM